MCLCGTDTVQSHSVLLVCRPHEVDALVFGHLAPLLAVPETFTSGELASQLRTAPGLEPLRRYIARLRSLYPLEPALLGAPCVWLPVQLFTTSQAAPFTQLFTPLFTQLMSVWLLCCAVVVRRVPLASGGTWGILSSNEMCLHVASAERQVLTAHDKPLLAWWTTAHTGALLLVGTAILMVRALMTR